MVWPATALSWLSFSSIVWTTSSAHSWNYIWITWRILHAGCIILSQRRKIWCKCDRVLRRSLPHPHFFVSRRWLPCTTGCSVVIPSSNIWTNCKRDRFQRPSAKTINKGPCDTSAAHEIFHHWGGPMSLSNSHPAWRLHASHATCTSSQNGKNTECRMLCPKDLHMGSRTSALRRSQKCAAGCSTGWLQRRT